MYLVFISMQVVKIYKKSVKISVFMFTMCWSNIIIKFFFIYINVRYFYIMEIMTSQSMNCWSPYIEFCVIFWGL